MQIKNTFKKRAQRGMTLIEASMVLVLSAVVISGAVMFYQIASENSKVQSALGEVGAIQSVVAGLLGGGSNYTIATEARVAASPDIPASFKNTAGTSLISPWGAVTFTSDADGYGFEFDNLTPAICTKLASLDLGGSSLGIGADYTTAKAGTNKAGAAGADAVCTGTALRSLAWAFH